RRCCGAPSVHVDAAELCEPAARRPRKAASADRRHRSLLVASREGASVADARMLVRRRPRRGARRTCAIHRGDACRRGHRRGRDLRSPRAAALLRDSGRDAQRAAGRAQRMTQHGDMAAEAIAAAAPSPRILYGTAWKKERTQPLVERAIELGFRGIDTAAQPKHYDEAAVGLALEAVIARGIVERAALYVQTKFTPYPGQDPSRVPYD